MSGAETPAAPAAAARAVTPVAPSVAESVPRPPPWRFRFVLVQVLQLPAVGLACLGQPPMAWWLAALWGSAVCCAGTDSGWRWRNRLLVLQATCWLLFALVFAVS